MRHIASEQGSTAFLSRPAGAMRAFDVIIVLQLACALAETVEIKSNIAELSEEEANSIVLPEKMRCDGCRAAAYKL